MRSADGSDAQYVPLHEWTGERTIAAPGSNIESVELPFQRWKRFKEAFAPEIVARAVQETFGPIKHIVDPFGGSGTTALTAQFMGVLPTTIEINPFLADLIEAKLATYDLDQASAAFSGVLQRASRAASRREPVFLGAPKTFVEPGLHGRFLFAKDVARRLLTYRDAIADESDARFRRLFRVILASLAVTVSNVTISGKGRRYRKGWQDRATDPYRVDELFQEGVLSALYDLRRFSGRKCQDYRVLCGDARHFVSRVGPFDLAVFSPPYPNSFDYTDVYNVELWTMGYLSNSESNIQLRRATLRSHVQIQRDMVADERASPALASTVRRLKRVQDQLWDSNIPKMIAAYAADMRNVLGNLASNLRAKGRVYMVVGDSRYAGVDVPIAKILAEQAPRLGYRICYVEPFRSMRSSPQQGGRHELAETLLALERS